MTRMALISPIALAACAPAPTAEDLVPEYLGIERTFFSDDLVQFGVSMSKILSEADLRDYADCAAAGYGVEAGFSYARHLRTNVYKEGGAFAADAVYTFSPTEPDGLVRIDVQTRTDACVARGIPTV